MVTLFVFEIINDSRVVFRSDYFGDEFTASRRAAEIVILMGKCAPLRMPSYRIFSVEVDAETVPNNFAL